MSFSARAVCWIPLLFLVASAGSAFADVEDGEALYRAGKYDECARLAAQELTGVGGWTERWRVLKALAEMQRGHYADAMDTVEQGMRRFPASINLRLLAREVYRYNGRADAVPVLMEELDRVVQGSPQTFAEPEARVALGRYFLLTKQDSRKILNLFYDTAIKEQPGLVEAYLAIAELALTKQDFALAAETLRKAPKEAAADPRYHFLLASAYSPEDQSGSEKELAEALQLNPHHVDSLLLRIDHLVDAEKYDEAAAILKQVQEVNPHEPRAFAYLAVLAHLRNDAEGETAARKSALAKWTANPEVDHLIGRKLSQKYRFAEGSAYQRRALEFDDDYQPARLQLCQDLLRLGEEDEGWKLAAGIFAEDAYNVVAYNLTTLHDQIARFRTLQGDGFVVRMDPREADLYGQRVLTLLARAKKTLAERYGASPPTPVIVEIFPQRRDFAVRTFGLPGADGLLGVCFGRVITANSPASQGAHPSSWEAVLWHEFCHVVTLSKTRNKMPRWLSEGISVYEEERADPSWATPMNPKFRAMILGKELTPLSQLSAAFLGAKTSTHLQFAYYESELAVAFLVERAGLPAFQQALDDLGAGVPINEALPRRTGMTLKQLDERFAAFARERAQHVAPQATWDEPELPPDADASVLSAWVEKHPKNFPGLRRLAAQLIKEGKLARARQVVETLRSLYPEYVGPENPYMLLAAISRKQSNTAAERKALEELVARDGSASPALLRLLDIEEAAHDWKSVVRDADRLLAVNPLIAAPYRRLAVASESLGDLDRAVGAYRAVVRLDDSDPSDLHYRLARLLQKLGRRDEARREVLKSLEEAPRFLDAHKLLLELAGKAATGPPTPATAPDTNPTSIKRN